MLPCTSAQRPSRRQVLPHDSFSGRGVGCVPHLVDVGRECISVTHTPSLSSCFRKRTLRLLPLPGTTFPDAPPPEAFLLVDMALLVALPVGVKPGHLLQHGGICAKWDIPETLPNRAPVGNTNRLAFLLSLSAAGSAVTLYILRCLVPGRATLHPVRR